MSIVIDLAVPAHIEHVFRLPDGRTFAAAEWGDPAGLPCVALHGTPGGRISWWSDPTIYARYGMRRITVDRPGYGGSTRLPGRTVADIVPDITFMLDALGIERLAVSGGSGGGPHALALAALMPDRVIRCLADVCPAPPDADGLDWLAGMTEGNVTEYQAALEGEGAARRLLEGLRQESLDRLAAGRLDWFGDDYDLSEADWAQMAKHMDSARAQVLDGLAPGADGWIDDNLAFAKPWGFDVAEIRVPVVLTYGRTDTLVPAAHGDWLARHIPGVEAWVDECAGHLGGDTLDREMAWLVQPDGGR